MYSSLIKTLFALLALVALSQAFAPAAWGTSSSKSALGLFGGKKKQGPKPGEQDRDVFAGRGERITIREDEDNAMWIDEPGDLAAKKKGQGKKGK